MRLLSSCFRKTIKGRGMKTEIDVSVGDIVFYRLEPRDLVMIYSFATHIYSLDGLNDRCYICCYIRI